MQAIAASRDQKLLRGHEMQEAQLVREPLQPVDQIREDPVDARIVRVQLLVFADGEQEVHGNLGKVVEVGAQVRGGTGVAEIHMHP
jgi:hypothetical protein